jgi:hypothetical protein
MICPDLTSDPRDCGACGTACGATDYCSGSACTCRPDLTACGAAGCLDLQHDVNNCGACGNDCTALGFMNARCVDGTCQDTTCFAIGETFCGGFAGGGVCFTNAEFQSDPLNCGFCGNACNNTQVCAGGNCRAYFTSPGVTSCPSTACGVGSTCCTYGTDTICVQGAVCP